MRAKVIAVVLGVGLAFAAGVTSSAWTLFGRTYVVSYGPMGMADGALSDRHQAIYVTDRDNPKTCVLVLMDNETKYFTTTAVDPGSCALPQ